MTRLDEIKARRVAISKLATEANAESITQADADFIVNAPTDIDWLIAEIERWKGAAVKTYSDGDDRLRRMAQQGNAEITRLRDLLARLEWASLCDGGVRDCGTCPVCYGHKDGRRHSPDCWLAEELAGEWPLRDE